MESLNKMRKQNNKMQNEENNETSFKFMNVLWKKFLFTIYEGERKLKFLN